MAFASSNGAMNRLFRVLSNISKHCFTNAQVLFDKTKLQLSIKNFFVFKGGLRAINKIFSNF